MKRRFIVMVMVTILLIMFGCTGVMANPDVTSRFTDVDSSNVKQVYINYLAARGIINGFPDGTFKPLEGLTRAEAATVIVKAKNLTIRPEQSSLFSDVDSSHWANSYIATAQEAGLLRGFPDNTFRPEQYLTRAEAVSLLLRLSNEVTSQPLMMELNDVENTHWAVDAINNSLVSGMVTLEGTNFYPDNPITRQDLAQALAVLLVKAPDLYETALNPILKVRQGTVKLISPVDKEERTIQKQTTIKVGDKIITTSNGEAEIIFPDGSGFLLKPGTEITLSESQGRNYIKRNGQIGKAVDNLVVKLEVGRVFAALATADITSMAFNQLDRPLFATLDDERQRKSKFTLVSAESG